MGMINFFKGFISYILPANSVGQGAQELEKKTKPKLFDVTDGYYVAEEARKWGANFFRKGHVDFKEFRRKVATHQKVRKNIADFYDLPEIVDEVTEKIYNESRQDPRLKKMFG